MFFIWIILIAKFPFLFIPAFLGWLGDEAEEAAGVAAIIYAVLLIVLVLIYVLSTIISLTAR